LTKVWAVIAINSTSVREDVGRDECSTSSGARVAKVIS
jgi:hypothetical protein